MSSLVFQLVDSLVGWFSHGLSLGYLALTSSTSDANSEDGITCKNRKLVTVHLHISNSSQSLDQLLTPVKTIAKLTDTNEPDY